MDKLSVIADREVFGKQFRIYGTLEEPLFLAKDVAEWIEYDLTSVHKLIAIVDQEEKVRKNVPTPGGEQEMWFLTEDGLYEVLMQSRKPIAKKFKKKVKEILKDIRRHGLYATDSLLDEMLKNPDFGIRLFTEYKREKEKRKQLELENAQHKQIIGEMRPKASYYDLILQNKSLLSMTKIAKDYGMSAKAMNKLLHELGVQYKMGNTWILYQKYADMGYTQSKTHALDAEKSVMHTYWTQKGRLFIYDLLKNKKGILPLIERNNKTA